MLKRLPATSTGAKNGKPWMWSQCACESRMVASPVPLPNAPLIIIVPLGKMMMSGAFGRGTGEATILLSHAHWDHIQGFPFFAPVLVAGNRFNIYGPSRSSQLLEGILEGQMNPHFSPI